MRLGRLAMVLPAAAALLAGCGADPYPDDVPGTFHTYFDTEMKGFDPIQSDEETKSYCVQNVYDSLYEFHWLKRPLELVPCLAAEMPRVSGDGLTWTIPLKRGVRFADDPCFPGGKGREFADEDRRTGGVEVSQHQLQPAQETRQHLDGSQQRLHTL